MMRQTILNTATFLNELANTMEMWAIHSRTGGWSTHQVEANRQQAQRCREEAVKLITAYHKSIGV